MQYRQMPKSQDKLSVLGFGCMRLPTSGRHIDAQEAKKQVLHAIENGVNYLDTAWPYHMGESESFLGEHILSDKSIREKVYVATKLPCFMINKAEKFDEIFQKQLEKLKVDYVDYYLLHSINGAVWDKMESLGIKEWMDKMKKEGKVRHMGFSFHGKHEDFPRIVDAYDFDFVQVQFNILDENFQAGIMGIDYAVKKDMGIIIMEPLRGGSLVGKIPQEVQKIYDTAEIKRSAAEWALGWIYNHPQVTLVLSGMNSIEQIDENIKTAGNIAANSLTEKENNIIQSVRDKYMNLLTVGCTGCRYCMPCPVGIDIPGSLQRLNDYNMFPKSKAKMYHMIYSGAITEDGKPHFAGSCIECGKCEGKCPQNIEIRKMLKLVKKQLEGPAIRAVAAFVRPIVIKKAKKSQ